MYIKEKLDKIIKKPSQGPLVSLSLLIQSHKIIDKDFDLDLGDLYTEIENQNQDILQSFRKIYTDFLWEDNESLDGFPKNSEERRNKINEILELPPQVIDTLNLLIKFGEPEHIQVFSDNPSKPWLKDVESNFHYWNTLKRHLLDKKLKHNPKKHKILKELDESSNAVLDYLEPPVTSKPYQTKGLVIGHVQSGKTLHMEGLVSKAIDCGYKVIIILTGRNTILRRQTQKRFDQDIFGREIIHPDIVDWANVSFDESMDKDYFDDPTFRVPYEDPTSTFVSHGFRPSSTTDSVLVQRVTDYTDNGLPTGRMPFSPFSFQGENNYDDLKNVPAHFVAINKTTGSIKKIIKLLKKAGTTSLKHMPVLIIDDEADSASVTPYTEFNEDGLRDEEDLQATNLEIRNLIKLLPRAQYVAYTATPYANVFVTSDDKDDLFPKDFITLLDAPDDYMGPKDFISTNLEEKFPHEDFSLYVRDVLVSDEENSIQNALDAFLLSGAIKLYREKQMNVNYGDVFPHHTMLVHTSHKNQDQEDMAEKVQGVWDNSDYTGAGLVRLKKLYEEDFKKTNELIEPYNTELKLPNDFNEIKKYIYVARDLIEQPPDENSDNIYILINQSNPTPSFNKNPGEPGVWKVLTGGNMLSRGYTIPDLTISYFTRVVTAGDTLEQMARWFGYRNNYKDLVRVFFARDARDNTRDLYEDFVDICKTEFGLRELLSNLPESKEQRFLRNTSPLDLAIYVIQEGRVPPTAAQKMRNIGLVSENFGGGKPFDKSQSFPSQGTKQDKENFKNFIFLIDNIDLQKKEFKLGKTIREFWIADVENELIHKYLSEFKWSVENPTKVLRWFLEGNLKCPKSKTSSIHYVPSHKCEPGIDNWKLIINNGASQLENKFRRYNHENYDFTVVARSPNTPQGWKSLESGMDSKFVNYIMNNSLSTERGVGNKALKLEQQKRTATIHGYLIDNKQDPKGEPSFGWIIRLPNNTCRKEIKLIPRNQISYE